MSGFLSIYKNTGARTKTCLLCSVLRDALLPIIIYVIQLGVTQHAAMHEATVDEGDHSVAVDVTRTLRDAAR